MIQHIAALLIILRCGLLPKGAMDLPDLNGPRPVSVDSPESIR